MSTPYVRPALKSNEAVVRLADLQPVKEALEQNQPQLALDRLKEALGPDIQPLEPFQIVDMAAAGESNPEGISSDLRIRGRLDWSALARQKQWLVSHAESSVEAAGLVELLDAIQDAAVDEGGVPDHVVFPTIDQEEADNGNVHGSDDQ